MTAKRTAKGKVKRAPKQTETATSTTTRTKYKIVKNADAPEEYKFNANEGRLQSLTKNAIIALNKIEGIHERHADDGIIRRSFINQAKKYLQDALDDSINNLIADVKIQDLEFKIRVPAELADSEVYGGDFEEDE